MGFGRALLFMGPIYMTAGETTLVWQAKLPFSVILCIIFVGARYNARQYLSVLGLSTAIGIFTIVVNRVEGSRDPNFALGINIQKLYMDIYIY